MYFIDEKPETNNTKPSYIPGLLLTERYYGKHPELLECEKLIASMSETLKKNPAWNPMESKENLMLMQRLQDLFNFEEFVIVWKNYVFPQFSPNAMTLPFGYLYTKKPEFETVETSNGIQFKRAKGKLFFMLIDAGIIRHTKMTPPEVLAVILHEIGHNFDISLEKHLLMRQYLVFQAIKRQIEIFVGTILFIPIAAQLLRLIGERVTAVMLLLTSILTLPITMVTVFLNDIYDMYFDLNLPKYRKQYKQIKKELRRLANDKKTKATKEEIKQFVAFWKSMAMIEEIWSILGVPIIGLITLLEIPVQITDRLADRYFKRGRLAEIFADSFAARYGYGQELARALRKFDVNEYQLIGDRLPVIGNIRKIIKQTAVLFDEHPGNKERMQEMINSLEAELKETPIGPKMKDAIRTDIRAIRRVIKRYDKPAKKIPKGTVAETLLQDIDISVIARGILGLIYVKDIAGINIDLAKLFRLGKTI